VLMLAQEHAGAHGVDNEIFIFSDSKLLALVREVETAALQRAAEKAEKVMELANTFDSKDYADVAKVIRDDILSLIPEKG